MVKALAFHPGGLGSIPSLRVICGFSFLVLFSVPSGFSSGTPVFPFPQKPIFDLISFELTSLVSPISSLVLNPLTLE